jgi:Chitin binding Peritrophin-A domain
MKVLLLVALAIFSPWAQGQQGDHPYGVCPDESGSIDDQRVLLADKKVCQKYYVCADGKPVAHYCFPGQEWHLKDGRCDFPANAKCVRPIGQQEDEDNSGEEQSGDTSLETGSGEQKSSDENNSEENKSNEMPVGPPEDPCFGLPTGQFLAHTIDCGKFYVCTGSASILMTCPSGLHFNATQKSCDWPQNSDCGMATDLSNPCTSEFEGRFLPHEINCGQYYQCVGGAAQLMGCPSILHFNAELSACDWPENVKCGLK